MRASLLLLLVALPCSTMARVPGAAEVYDAALIGFEAERVALAKAYAQAAGEQKAAIRAKARARVLAFLDTTVFPSWMGMQWGLGRNSTATRPFEDGMVVGCSYFVTSVLQNAGLKLSNRYHFAQAPALHIQRSLAPRKADLHIYYSEPADKITRRIKALGAGLYIIGLNNHVAFVRVRDDGAVRLIHASYTDDQVVIDEPFAAAAAIHNSRKAGYFVTPVFQDDRLIDHWLRGAAVPFQKLGR